MHIGSNDWIWNFLQRHSGNTRIAPALLQFGGLVTLRRACKAQPILLMLFSRHTMDLHLGFTLRVLMTDTLGTHQLDNFMRTHLGCMIPREMYGNGYVKSSPLMISQQGPATVSEILTSELASWLAT